MAAGSSKPVLYYTFENGTGTVVTDRSNAGNDLHGGRAVDEWDSTNKMRGSSAFSANAVLEAVGDGNKPGAYTANTIGDVTSMNFIHQTRVFTISLWARFSEIVVYTSLCGNVASTSRGFYFGLHDPNVDGTAVFETYGGAQNTGDGYSTGTWTPTLNQWYHLVYTGNGAGTNTAQIYVDSVLFETLDGHALLAGFNSTNSWVVGDTAYLGNLFSQSYSTAGFRGQMDEYSLWDAHFTSDDVASLYNNGAPYDLSNGLVAAAAGLPSAIKKLGPVASADVKKLLTTPAASIRKVIGRG